MDSNFNNLSNESFYFNEEGLKLLKDTLEAVQIAFRKVRYLEAYVHDKLILKNVILPKDNVDNHNEIDKQNRPVEFTPEVSGNTVDPCTELSLDQNSTISNCHLSSEDPTSIENPSFVELPSKNEVFSEDELKIFVSIKFNRVTEIMLKKVFEKTRFQHFVINSLRNLTDRSIGVISFRDKEDVNRAVKLNYKLSIYNRPLIICPYGKKNDDTQGIQSVLSTGNINSSKEIDENALINVSSGYQNNRNLGMITSEERRGCNVPDNLFFYPVEPQGSLDMDRNVNTSNCNPEPSIINESSKSHSNYNNKCKENFKRESYKLGQVNKSNKQFRYFNYNRYRNKNRLPSAQNTMRDNRGLKFNRPESFSGGEYMNHCPYNDYSQNQLHFQKEMPKLENEGNEKNHENDVKNDDKISSNTFNNASSYSMCESKNTLDNNLFYNQACNSDQNVNAFTTFSFVGVGPSQNESAMGTLNGANFAGNRLQPQLEGWPGESLLQENYANTLRFSKDPVYNPIEQGRDNSQQKNKYFQMGKECSKTKNKPRRWKKSLQTPVNCSDINKRKKEQSSKSKKKNKNKKNRLENKALKQACKGRSSLKQKRKNRSQQKKLNSQKQPPKNKI